MHPAQSAAGAPGTLLDRLAVAAVVLDPHGRIVLWSPEAEGLFGYTAEEALGRHAISLLADPEHQDRVSSVFAQIMDHHGTWAGVFPIRHKNGTTRLVEFRDMGLENEQGRPFVLALAADQYTVRTVERERALAVKLIDQSPIGLAVFDHDLRYVSVNQALARINGLRAEAHPGKRLGEVLPFLDTEAIEDTMRQVLTTGTPVLDQRSLGHTRLGRHGVLALSASYYRLEDPGDSVLGLAVSVVDITEQHLAAAAAQRAQHRLAVIADASARIGTALDLYQTAAELADVAVAGLADIAAVDVLDSVIPGRHAGPDAEGGALFRALAVAAAVPTEALAAADQAGEIARYGSDRLVTRCVRTGQPVHIARIGPGDLACIARDADSAETLARVGVHTYLAVPLVARGEILGVLDLKRFRNAQAFDGDDLLLATDLAARAAVAIDNARWYQHARDTALTLQRSLLPRPPNRMPGLTLASRYLPADAADEIGGDWYDAITLPGGKTALTVGDVMGSGIPAAATMGRLRTALATLAPLDLPPGELLRHLDTITENLGQSIATCMYGVYDPRTARCCLASAGHLPPVLLRPGRSPEVVDVAPAPPLGVGGLSAVAADFDFRPGDALVMYTDGLVETRDADIEQRLAVLVQTLAEADGASAEELCDHMVRELGSTGAHDDIAVLVARADALEP
ncbi:SpoIIE family protein phosphatase [Streptacidiphilus sp. PB12-B1b]|uniref:SpoIIE family protein phosphatase n=1 Tax=Streptacidiphilus sp. PB12-B1b TaxID=2705012 RepID=UPI0015FA18D7|nr:SpoIIE family protein phosphatase [Streptacidiphilus sp. PB12-B1b]QMU80263.1 SpoIIE family protein phosphatase [Streptacidiphilus sp. PB12-B1b]